MKLEQNFDIDEPRKQNEKVWPQILAIFIVSLTPFICGCIFAWTSPFIVVITEDKENYNISEDEASYFTVMPAIGSLCSSVLLFLGINDRIGRKNTLILFAIPQFLFFFITIFARSAYVFYVARFIAGMSDSSLFGSMPMFVGEISTPQVRGTWGNLITIMFYFGTFAINVVGSFLGVKETGYLFVGLPIIFIILMLFIPESPYYYIMKNNYDDARQSLKWLRRKENIEAEFEQIKIDVERQISESGTFKDLFLIPTNRMALGAACFLRYGQQMSGLTVFQIYTQLIFKYSRANISASAVAIIYSGLLNALNFFSGLFVNRLGRKMSFMTSIFLAAFALIFEGVYFYISDNVPSINLDSLRWFPIFGILLWVVFFAIGIGSVPTLMLGELFSASIKSKGLAVTNVFQSLSTCSQAYFFYFMSTYIGLYFPFMFYGFMCFVNTFITLRAVPETKGKSLEEIQQKMKNKTLQRSGLSKTKDVEIADSVSHKL